MYNLEITNIQCQYIYCILDLTILVLIIQNTYNNNSLLLRPCTYIYITQLQDTAINHNYDLLGVIKTT